MLAPAAEKQKVVALDLLLEPGDRVELVIPLGSNPFASGPSVLRVSADRDVRHERMSGRLWAARIPPYSVS